MQIRAVTKVPAITCPKSCFPNFILDQAISGENRKNRRKYGENKYANVKKSRVEYVICPLIFQKNVTIVITDATTKIVNETSVSITIPCSLSTKNSIPKRIERVTKYGGLSSLFVSS